MSPLAPHPSTTLDTPGALPTLNHSIHNVPRPLPAPKPGAASAPEAGPSSKPTALASKARRERHSLAATAAIRNAARRRPKSVPNAAQLPKVVPGQPVNLHFRIPERLSRPTKREPNPDALASCGLVGVPIAYIVDQLKDVGPRMLASVRQAPIITEGPTALPKHLEITLEEILDFIPSHVLAVFSQTEQVIPGAPRRCHYFPVHDVILAANCPSLPALPAKSKSQPTQAGDAMTLPVVTLSVPNSATFALLFNYLYTKRIDGILPALLPGVTGEMKAGELLQHLSKQTPQELTKQLFLTHQLWQNVCALGVYEDALFRCIDAAWAAILQALRLANRNGTSQVTVTSLPRTSAA
ncbi:hypothetical protein BKA62DRAFT_685687 [Auriculariales sp. MPI-PUGE-AT-0066]|nr:hypothetical protein BKA62DRAFT_685687 [Auriculariales sp. MPI-PUGE-AT-0066]